MKLEVVKSYILLILVGISLILTFGLWTYQPNEDYLDRGDYVPEENFDLGGVEQTKGELVTPSSIIFEKYNKYYSIADPSQLFDLYENLQSWTLYDFREGEANGRPTSNQIVEVIYPVELPMDVVPSLFSLNNPQNILLPDWSFQRIYITLNQTDNTLTLQFLSIDGRRQAKVNVTNGSHYEFLRSKITDSESLVEYVKFQPSDIPIYMPAGDVLLNKYNRITIHEIEPNLLEHALFNNPSGVIRNISPENEAYYQDGQRTMKVFPNGLSMEYVNPQVTASKSLTVSELLDFSIKDINSYKGWVNDYHLNSIDRTENMVRYRLHFEGYPVFHNDNLDIIEQKWTYTDLYQQISPLYTISPNYFGDEVTLLSGKEIITILENHPDYEIEKISDVKVGYRLFESSSRNSLILTPAWYMNYDGKWLEVPTVENEHSKGVS